MYINFLSSTDGVLSGRVTGHPVRHPGPELEAGGAMPLQPVQQHAPPALPPVPGHQAVMGRHVTLFHV